MNSLSPGQVILLMQIHAIPGPHSEGFDSTIEQWVLDGVIERLPNRSTEYRTTKKGSKWVDMICETPKPISLWCDPREKK